MHHDSSIAGERSPRSPFSPSRRHAEIREETTRWDRFFPCVLRCSSMLCVLMVSFSAFAQPFQTPEPIPPAPIPGPAPKPLPPAPIPAPAPKPIPPAPPR